MNFEEIKNDEQQYMMHTYGRFNTALVKGKGAVSPGGPPRYMSLKYRMLDNWKRGQ